MATAFCGRDLADLQIGARGDMRVAAAIALRQVGNSGELRCALSMPFGMRSRHM